MKSIKNNMKTLFSVLFVISFIFITSFTVKAGLEDAKGMTDLMEALWENEDIKIIKGMLEDGADVTSLTETGMDPLMYAAAGNEDPAVIKLLLEKENDTIKNLNSINFNALMYALKYNSNFEVIKVLIDEMEENIDTDDLRLMHAAANNKDLRTIKELIEGGADVTATTKRGLTVLMCAVIGNENPEVIQYLIDRGASVHARTNFGESVLMYAAAGNRNPNIIDVLLDAGANINSKNKLGMNTLDYALASIENAKKEIVKRLLKNDIKINISSDDLGGQSLLMGAIHLKVEPEILELLIDTGAKVNMKDNFGNTALHYAAKFSEDPGVIKILIEGGAEINIKNNQGRTPLLNICLGKKSPDILKVLLKNGANVNIEDKNWGIPLFYALRDKPEDITSLREFIALLLEQEDIELTINTYHSEYNTQPLILAVEKIEDPKIVKMLIDAHDNINVNNADGESPLHKSVYNKNYEMTKILVDAALNNNNKSFINGKGRDRMLRSKTPLMIAAEHHKSPEIIELLLDSGADGSIKYEGKTAFDYIEKNEHLKDTDVYWRLNDAQY